MKKYFFYFIAITSLLAGCSGKDKGDSIRVMTFNIRYDNPADSINAWPYRINQVHDFIINEDPDIIGMQEVLWHQYNVLDSLLTDYTSLGAGRDDGARAGEMNPVFFKTDKFDMVRNITFWLSETPDIPGSRGWGASLPRIVTWMELVSKETHDHFFYFNTHFAHDSDSARIKSSEILLDKVSEIAQGFPFIITGDFNMLPDSKGYSILTGPDENIALFRDAYFISAKKPYGPAFTFNGFSDKPGPGRIDYVFVKNGMKVLEHKTMIQRKGNVYISDHWPVEAVVSIR
jgi:endonuclease/exonuclease/phosphatase family metal-dependent hydrolase